jgi:GPI mannosyltransferase 3
MNKTDIKLFLLITAIVTVYFTTAYFSKGFYHADEHYQILEFAGFKLGTHTSDELAWEFKAQIRPALQPVLAAGIIKVLEFAEIKNPYHIAFVFRLLSALLTLLVITRFYLTTKHLVTDKMLKTPYILATYFLWFIPFISVRFSSETWSALFFMVGLTTYLNNRQKPIHHLFIGILMGLSFEFRYQAAFMIAGYLCWLILNDHKNLHRVIITITGIAIVITLSFFIDSWFYNQWVFAPWNYFYANIIEGAAAGFGTLPWYYYLLFTIKYPGVLIGVPLLLSFGLLALKQPKSIYVWIILPFVIAHSITAHKELRFLFPIVYFVPLILVLGYQNIKPIVDKSRVLKTGAVIYFTLLFLFNSTGLIAMAIKPAGLGFMDFTHYIYRNYHSQSVNLFHSPYTNPYNPWHCLPNKFYGRQNVTSFRIDEPINQSENLLPAASSVNLLILRKSDLENPAWKDFIDNHHFQLIRQSTPRWIEKINTLYRGLNRNEILLLYQQKTVDIKN